MKKRGFKSFVAMLALVSMLLENTATVFAVDADSYQEQGGDNIEVTSEAGADVAGDNISENGSEEMQEPPAEDPQEEQPQEEPPAEEPQGEQPSEEQQNGQPAVEEQGGQPSEEQQNGQPADGEQVNSQPEGYTEENAVPEEQPQEEVIPESVEIKDGNRIEISGYDYFYLAVDTDQMNDKDTFRIVIEGLDTDSWYDSKLDGELNKFDASLYKFEDLNKR
ncbi:MAG: hypothetical protein K5770_14270, partial [Lachnospiraceae bacterium]|nr:hypothetical protein [Lachnospiraceae bacterium]